MKRWLLAFAGFLAFAPLRAETVAINQFSGLNTDDSPLTLSNGQTADSENVTTDDGPGLQGRKGFISFATQTPLAMWEFPKSDGTRYLIANVGTRLLADTGSGTFTTLVSTVPSDRTVAGSVLGDKFYFADTLNGLKYWDGTSVTVSSTSMKVDKLVTWKGRLAAAGITASQRVIFLSKYLDGTSWTAPTNPSDDDAAQITVAGALDENVQALFSSFKDLLMWFKKNSFGAIYGSRRSNFSQRTFSDYVGVASPETIRDCDGLLRWLGNNRKVWEFDGATFKKISEDIDSIFATVAQGDSSSKSTTITTEAQFEAGAQSPTNFLDTTATPGNITPQTTTYTDTSQLDFSSGTCSPATYCDTTTISGSVYLATTTPVSSFVDTNASDFGAGAATQVSTTVTAGSLTLSFQPQFNAGSSSCGGSPVGACDLSDGRSFQVPTTIILSSVTLPLGKTGAPSGGLQLRIYTDSGNSPGTQIARSIDWSVQNLTSSTAPVVFSNWVDNGNNPITAPTLLASTTYWIKLNQPSGTCNTATAHYLWDELSTCDTSRLSIFNETAITGNGRFGYIVTGTTYYASGNLVSRTFDTAITTATWLWSWSTFTVTQTLNGGTATYQTQTSSDSVNWNSLASVVSGSTPTSTVQRYFRYKISLTGGTTNTPQIDDITIPMTDRIRPTAQFTSRAFDTGLTPPVWGLLTATVTQQNGGGTTGFMTQASNDAVTWDTAVVASTGSKIPSTTRRYVRYIYQSTATAPANYARLDATSFTTKSTGSFTTAAINIGSQISSWGPLAVTLSNSGGSFTISMATSSNGVSFGPFTTVTNNSTPIISTAPYAEVRLLFTMDVATQTPNVDDITLNWTEGSTVRAASAYTNQRYWLAVAIGATTNNRVLVFDKKRQWQRFNGINIDACTLYNSKLYFGNTSGIFEAENGYSDNSSAIASYYQTPTIIPNKLDLYSNFDYLYMTTDSSDATLTTTYQINGIATNYSMAAVQMNATTGIQNFKLPFSAAEVQTGKNISFKWSVSGSSFWRITNGTLYHQPLALPE